MIKYLEKDFENELNNKKVLVDFYANWCGPCKMLSEVFEEVKDQIALDIVKIDVDKFPEIASHYNVFSIPTIFLMENLKIIRSHVGYLNPKELLEFVNEK